MKITKGSIATIKYSVLNAKTGQTLQQSLEQGQELLFGYDLLIDAFEQNLYELEAGSRFSFESSAKQAYGNHDPQAVLKLHISIFHDENGKVDTEALQIGHIFPMADKNGNRHFGKVISIENESVTMDFNHPLAGFDLLFQGEILAVRPASADELPHTYNGGCEYHPADQKQKSILEK
jgi:FKBP-type peptidyl-prolyl cis-trans isomerase SlyD